MERSSDFQKLKIGLPCALQTSAINYLATQRIILEWRHRLHRAEYLTLSSYCYVHQEARPIRGICVENFFELEVFLIGFGLRVKILRFFDVELHLWFRFIGELGERVARDVR
jgi:hypothetical protein